MSNVKCEEGQPSTKQEIPAPQTASWACLESQAYTLIRPILPEPPYPVMTISEEKFYPVSIPMPVAQDTRFYNPLTEGVLEYRQPASRLI